MKYALVTGGSRGIGRAVCVKLAQMGYCVVVNYVSNDAEAQKTLELIEQAGSQGELLKFDVSKDGETVVAIEAWQEAHKGEFIEVLVNNAGIRKDNLLLWMEQEDWDKVLGIGLHGFYNVTRPLVKAMSVKKRGRIINMASVSGLKGLPGQCNYSASKAGLIGLTKSVAKELAPKGIRCNAVAPGFISTDMTGNQTDNPLLNMIPLGRMGETEDVADAVAYLVTAKYVTGEVLRVDGGIAM